MPIPDLSPDTGYLPGGLHDATLDEVRERFAYNHRRRKIFDGLTWTVQALLARKVTTTRR